MGSSYRIFLLVVSRISGSSRIHPTNERLQVCTEHHLLSNDPPKRAHFFHKNPGCIDALLDSESFFWRHKPPEMTLNNGIDYNEPFPLASVKFIIEWLISPEFVCRTHCQTVDLRGWWIDLLINQMLFLQTLRMSKMVITKVNDPRLLVITIRQAVVNYSQINKKIEQETSI